MVIPFTILGGALVLMAVIPLRHLSRVRGTEEEYLGSGHDNSIARAPIVAYLDRLEHWYRFAFKDVCLRSLDRTLRALEYMTGHIAGQTKKARLMLQEHFKVIPRESMYWKNIQTWKKNGTNNNGETKNAPVEDQDLSSHE
ncbi:MAG: hypothetical protein O2794_00890 [bacterium]|nr:hypothetical protein [bacterium]